MKKNKKYNINLQVKNEQKRLKKFKNVSQKFDKSVIRQKSTRKTCKTMISIIMRHKLSIRISEHLGQFHKKREKLSVKHEQKMQKNELKK